VSHDQTSTDPASNIIMTISLPYYVTFKMTTAVDKVQVSKDDEEVNNVQIKVNAFQYCVVL